jgi:DNA polymerase II small subunit/DNA polymerase delta subunit B
MMSKKDMIKQIVSNGLLVSPDVLDYLNEDTLQSILQQSDKASIVLESVPAAPAVVHKKPRQTQPEVPLPAGKTKKAESPAAVKKDPKSAASETGISIGVTEVISKQKFSPDDFVKYYNNKYNTLKDILLKKTGALSVNKAADSASPITVIGMVKEMTQHGFVIEDPTGEIEVVTSPENNISEDDVLAVSGYVREGKLFGKEMIFPDVPLTHASGTIEARLMFSETPPKQLPQVDVLCSPSKIVTSSGSSAELPNPAMISVTKKGKTINILVYRPAAGTELSDAVSMLKKRHLSPKRGQVFGPDDPFMIKPIPEIFWLVSASRGIKIYKGVTIISCGQKSAAVVDMATQKVGFIDT